MKILTLLVLLLLGGTTLAAQVYKTNPHNNTLAIKGKILPWTFLYFPLSGMNYTLGAEYGLNKANAVGFELVYNDNVTHKEYTRGPAADSAGANTFSVSRGIFLYYKRYFTNCSPFIHTSLDRMFDKETLPYLSVFARYGKKDWHHDMYYETSNITHDEWQYSAGILVGVVRSYFDINMGPFYKQSYISNVDITTSGPSLTSHMRPSIGFRIGVNLFLVVKRRGNHLLADYAGEYQ